MPLKDSKGMRFNPGRSRYCSTGWIRTVEHQVIVLGLLVIFQPKTFGSLVESCRDRAPKWSKIGEKLTTVKLNTKKNLQIRILPMIQLRYSINWKTTIQTYIVFLENCDSKNLDTPK